MKGRRICNWNRIRVSMLLSLLALIFAGCGQRMGEVSGSVSYKGKALPSGQVMFFGADKQLIASSSIVEGKYKILKVPPGPVKIGVTTPPPPPPGNREAKQNAPNRQADQNAPPQGRKGMPPPLESIAIPPKYGNPEQSGLTYEVKPGSQEHPIDLN